eukprot:TRINITY_DN21094_c0_g1_i1.p1 TRINITY_DN21094_c0_g1~~TRINITY_DN21094_c0_g1_i1.p1  ORF type:complete len:219 (+),score=59.49 TRINITY_DN21094_c0_g1_i1:2-658(+)
MYGADDGFMRSELTPAEMRGEAYKMLELVNQKLHQRQMTLDGMSQQLRRLQRAREDDAREATAQIMQLKDSITKLTMLVDKAHQGTQQQQAQHQHQQQAPQQQQPQVQQQNTPSLPSTSGAPTPTAASASAVHEQAAGGDPWDSLLGVAAMPPPAPATQQEEGNPPPEAKSQLDYCHNCMRSAHEKNLLLCGGCRNAAFCDRQCQMDAWPKHRTVCGK